MNRFPRIFFLTFLGMLSAQGQSAFTVTRAYNVGASNVAVVFSSAVDPVGATNPANYAFVAGPAISDATLGTDAVTVTLSTGSLTYGSNYWLMVSGIQSSASNSLPENTVASFVALPYVVQEIGKPAVTSVVSVVDGGINISAAGAGIGGTSDQFSFNWQQYTGDFDLSVRVAGFDPADIWSKAGLMARETLDANSRFAAAVATPTMNGEFFEYRATAAAASVRLGSFPPNYPNAWLRVKRAGNVFSGFASYDGQAWGQLGSTTIAMTNRIYVGLAVSSRVTNQVATARVRDMSATTTNSTVATLSSPRELPGPSSRKTPIVFSEIMYRPAPRQDSNNVEFIEIYNSNPWQHDISNYRVVAENLSYTFPAGSTIAAGAYLVVAADPASMTRVYGITNLAGAYTGSLKTSGTLQLIDEQGAVLLTVPYSNQNPWPIAADGTGHSLVLANPTYGEADPRAWDISDRAGGSPGAFDSYRPAPLRSVVINEFLAHTESLLPARFLELYNHSSQTNDLSGCILTDDPTRAKCVIPAGTLIGPGGFVSFGEQDLQFALDAKGGKLYLINPDQSRVLDAVSYEAQANGVSFGRWPDGAAEFYSLASPTPGQGNSDTLIGDIVINELMYDPISGNDDDQYIELYNRGTNSVNLQDWKLSSAVSFTFTNVTMAPDSYLVVGRNVANLQAKYTNLNSGNTIGNFSGKLSHNGERVVLTRPDVYNGTKVLDVVADEVTYGTGGRWGQWAAGGGSSLELVDPHSNHRLAANWADSDESQKSAWTNIETTGVLDNGQNYVGFVFPGGGGGTGTIGYAQIGLLDGGECLVDNLEVRLGTNGANLVANPTFESGLANWSLQGCHARSTLENSGYSSTRSLHIRCSSRIWTGVNSCQMTLSANTLASGNTVTMRYKARWICGWPEVLMRLNGNWLEATCAMPVPTNLGTPGAANSRRSTNSGPAVFQVTHSPAVPAASQPVVVTARVHDADGVQGLTLNYRLDPALIYTAVPMVDDGTGGDAIAKDGIFSATIPGQVAKKIAAFFISATDAAGATNRFPALLNDNSPVRECAVLFGDGDPGGSFGVYHLWVTATNSARLTALADLSNEQIDATMVNGSRVIYNAFARFAGSPFHQNFDSIAGSLCHYKWSFPEDDKFLGATSFNKIHQPGNGAGDDSSIQREQLAHTLLRGLGIPWLNRRYVAVYVNGSRRGTLMEDAQCPDADVIKEYYPDDAGGFLFKMQPWFEFAATPTGTSIGMQNVSWCNLLPYTTTGGAKKAARYRYMFETRRTPDSANNFSNVFALIDAANSYSSPKYVANMQNIANMENWMRMFAANHAAGNWDSFGAQNSQNVYGYIGQNGLKYTLHMWDFNIVFGNGGSWGAGQNLFGGNTQDSTVTQIFNNPTFRRMYWRALQELVNGPLSAEKSTPLVTSKYNAFTANGLSVENPATSLISWVAQAKSSIASQLAAVDSATFAVNTTVNITNDVAYITGKAPIAVKTVLLNGVQWPLTWTSLTNWSVAIPLKTGTNALSITGTGMKGQVLAGTSNTVSVVYSNDIPSPAGRIVINEIMFAPAAANAEYIELFNTSTNTAFDLSSWELRGLGYTFPAGSMIQPTNYLVLAANRTAFAQTYGATNLVFDTFSGSPQPLATLSLVEPGTGTNADLVVTAVRFEDAAPWPTNAHNGRSLQLVDAAQDNWRAGNWSTANPSPGTANSIRATIPAFPSLWINELEPQNLTGITNSAGQQAPWLEIYNPGTVAVSLDGLFISDGYGALTNWALPSGLAVNPGEFKVIFADGQTNLSTSTEIHASAAFTSNTGTVALSRVYNGSVQVLDYVNYNAVTANRSWGSLPDGQSFVRREFYHATPGSANDGSAAPLTVVINEWMASNTHTLPDPADKNNYDDWFELYNYGDAPANLAGYYLTQTLTNKLQFQIPSGYVIPPHGFLRVWADRKSTVGWADLHAGFKLNKAGACIALFGPDETAVDYVVFGAQSPDISQGRYPDAGPLVYSMTQPTSGTNNVYANSAPILTAIADKPLVLGQTVSFVAHATDIDAPPQSLRFSLGSGAPTGAEINPTTGEVTWKPDYAPATNLVRVIATDDGTPSLSATQTFVVTVGIPPQLSDAHLSANGLTLTWPAMEGVHYQLEYTTDVGSTNWIPVTDPLTGTGVLSTTNAPGNDPHRFYRLRVLP